MVSRELITDEVYHLAAPPGSWCGGDIVCNGGSECYNSVCSCPFGQINVNLQCVSAPLGIIQKHIKRQK